MAISPSFSTDTCPPVTMLHQPEQPSGCCCDPSAHPLASGATLALLHQRWFAPADLRSSNRLIGGVIAASVASGSADVVAPRTVLPALHTLCTDPTPDSAVPAEFYWHRPVHAGSASVPSVDDLVTTTLAEWPRLPTPVHVPLIPQDVSTTASTEL